MRKQMAVMCVIFLSACSVTDLDGDPGIIAEATSRGRIEVRPVVGVLAMCTLRLELQGDVSWTGGDLVMTSPIHNGEVNQRTVFDAASVKSLEANGYTTGSGNWPWRAKLTLDWKRGPTTGSVSHTYTCVTD